MSVIGPRPQLVRDMVFMTGEQRKRHTVRPGLSGLAQVNGRNVITWEDKFDWDLKYIEKITFLGDVKIIFETIGKVFKRVDINREGTVSDMDFGDYLLKKGAVSKDEYDRKQTEAKELLRRGCIAGLSTYSDPLRTTNFAQDWTIYYWAYWMVWCVAAPFFIGNISRGRTVKQVICGGYIFGVGSTIVSFVVLGNYGMGLQTKGITDFLTQYEATGDLYGLIIDIINTMPAAPVILVIVMLTMIAFYATSFDSIAYTAACYSYKKLEDGEQPHKLIELMWCILLIILPIALVFSESSMSNIQSVSIISAFPIAFVMIMMIAGFIKDAKKYMDEDK